MSWIENRTWTIEAGGETCEAYVYEGNEHPSVIVDETRRSVYHDEHFSTVIIKAGGCYIVDPDGEHAEDYSGDEEKAAVIAIQAFVDEHGVPDGIFDDGCQ